MNKKKTPKIQRIIIFSVFIIFSSPILLTYSPYNQLTHYVIILKSLLSILIKKILALYVKYYDRSKKVSSLDLFYDSIGTFTFINQGNWYSKDIFRKWVALEGVLGWTCLGIFMETLIGVVMRI